jgi:integrase/recombinase XerD
MKISQATKEFLATLAGEGRSPHTVAAYHRDLMVFIRFAGDTDITDITPVHLTRFMAHRSVTHAQCGVKRAKSTVNRYRVALKALFAWAEARWLIERNPTAILKCKRHRSRPPVVLSEEEIAKVISSKFKEPNASRDHALITFMLLTGCRLGETIALNVGDIDLKAQTALLRNPKGGAPHRIFLAAALRAAWESQNQRSHPARPLWSTASGRRISGRQGARIVAKRVAEIGITKPVTPHTLRHTFATRLYNQTGDIRLVQQALRHEHVTTTEAYAQVDPQRLREAIETSGSAL